MSQNEGQTLRTHSMLSNPGIIYLLNFNGTNTRKAETLFQSFKVTIKIDKEVNWLRSITLIINFEQIERNAKGNDDFATNLKSRRVKFWFK